MKIAKDQIVGTDWPLQIDPYSSPELDVNLFTRNCFLMPYFIDMKSTVNVTRG